MLSLEKKKEFHERDFYNNQHIEKTGQLQSFLHAKMTGKLWQNKCVLENGNESSRLSLQSKTDLQMIFYYWKSSYSISDWDQINLLIKKKCSKVKENSK